MKGDTVVTFAARQVDITPDAKLPMGGFPNIRAVLGAPTSQIPGTGYVPREGNATGTLDPLLATVLVVDDGEHSAAIVALDLLLVTLEFTRDLRRSIHAATGIAPEAIVVQASHTHAAPEPFGIWEEKNQPYLDEVARRVARVASEAFAQREPGVLYAGSCDVGHLLVNRRVPPGPIDPRMKVVRIEAEQGGLLALLVHVACHPLVLPPGNLLYSAEWPGALRDALQADGDAPVPILYLNGAAGNINPAGYPLQPKEDIIAQHRRLVREGAPTIRDPAHMRRIGEGMAEVAKALLPHISPGADPHARQRAKLDAAPVRVARRDAWLPLKSPERLALYCEYLAVGEAARAHLMSLDAFPTEVQLLSIGSLQILALPGEPFIETALALEQDMGGQLNLVLGFSNDDPRYIPTDEAFDGNAYDTFGTPLDRGAEGALMAAAQELLAQRVGGAR